MIVAYFLITARQGKLRIASSALREHGELEEVHETLGCHDIIAKGLFEDAEDLKTFIQNKLQIAEGVKGTQTLLVLD